MSDSQDQASVLSGFSSEELLSECVRRNLMSSSTAIRMLRLSTRDLQREADIWILSNPILFKRMERMAAAFAKKGRRFGAKLLAEEIRWNERGATCGKFKINNCLVPYLAKRMVERNPRLSPFINMRRTRA